MSSHWRRQNTHTHHRNHIFCWLKHTHGFPSAGRSSLDIWFCRPAGGRWFPETASPCPHSHPETGSCFLEGSPRTRTASAGRSIARGCHLQDGGRSIYLQDRTKIKCTRVLIVLVSVVTYSRTASKNFHNCSHCTKTVIRLPYKTIEETILKRLVDPCGPIGSHYRHPWKYLYTHVDQ